MLCLEITTGARSVAGWEYEWSGMEPHTTCHMWHQPPIFS